MCFQLSEVDNWEGLNYIVDGETGKENVSFYVHFILRLVFFSQL